MTIFIFKVPIQPIYIIYSLHNPILLSVLQISISCISCIDFSKFYAPLNSFINVNLLRIQAVTSIARHTYMYAYTFDSTKLEIVEHSANFI